MNGFRVDRFVAYFRFRKHQSTHQQNRSVILAQVISDKKRTVCHKLLIEKILSIFLVLNDA